MDRVLEEIKGMAREIVDDSRIPSFYKDYEDLINESKLFFDKNPLINKIRTDVYQTLEDNFGHGYGHAKKVSIEAGVVFVIEMRQAGIERDIQYMLSVAQTAGLLHDICRKEKNHAKRGAEYAKEYLPSVFIFQKNVDAVVHAISNHEAFCDYYAEPPSLEAAILSDSLYDSDKFRWGPDNFSHMIWAMLENTEITAGQFLSGYQRGIGSLEKIRQTFRTQTGKKYGPEFIDIGIEIGNRLYKRINNEFDFFFGG